jgi:signal transduction histidine kinase
MLDPSNYALNPHAFPVIIIGIFTLGLGILAYFASPLASANRHFLVLCVSITVWLCATAGGLSSTDRGLARQWFRIDNVGVMFISVAFYAFSATFLNLRRPVSTTLGYFLAIVLAGIVLTSDNFVAGVHEYWWGYYPQWGRHTWPFILVFFTYMAAAFLDYIRSYKRVLHPVRRNQIQSVFVAFLIAYTGSVDFLPAFGVPIYPFGYIPIFGLVTVITFAMLQYRLMDITVIVKKILAYLFVLAFVAVPGFVILEVAQKIYFGEINTSFSVLALIVLALVVVGTFKMKTDAETTIARTIFKSRYDMYQTLSQFSKSLVTILDLRSLSEEIVRTLVHVLGAKTASLFLLEKDQGLYTVSSSYGVDAAGAEMRLPIDHKLPHHLTCSQSILVRQELALYPPSATVHPILDTLKMMECEVCIPLVNKDRLIGFCTLGLRTHNQMYSEEDFDLLTMLAQNAAIALDNAMLYEDLKRSQILMRRTDRLRSLETIAGGFAHEIRNPLTSIKTFVQLAPDRKDDPEFIGHFSQVVSEDVDRIERLIQEILDYARYMEPKFTEEDLNDIVASCLYFIEVKADGKSIQVEKTLAADLPRVMLDRQQIKQVLLNLFLNAMDAMGDRGGRLTVRTHRLTKSGASWVQIEVADTGSGISPADLEHIFDPFYTTKHESGEREGTGLGLTIVHQIVQEHYGYIDVTSHVGSGTSFSVNLPVNPQPQQLAREQEEHEKTSPIGR